MKCAICKHGETRPGKTTVTLQRNGMTLVIRNVPAEVCENCGEAYVDEATARELLHRAEDAACAGVMVDVREYAGIAEE
jgi:YgiT-type zinc finger domain-containing protein